MKISIEHHGRPLISLIHDIVLLSKAHNWSDEQLKKEIEQRVKELTIGGIVE